LDRAARQPERHWPQRVLPRPVDGEVDARDDQAFFEAVLDPRHKCSFAVRDYCRDGGGSQASGGRGSEARNPKHEARKKFQPRNEENSKQMGPEAVLSLTHFFIGFWDFF